MSQGENGVSNLQELLDRLDDASDDSDRISIDDVHRAVGRRSFGPALLVPGLLALSPLSGMPGVPTTVGVMVLLVSGQLLAGRSEFWLPRFVLDRSISRERFQKAARVMRPVARFLDALLKRRLTIFSEGPVVHAVAAASLMLAVLAPLLEVLPFAITGVGAAITVFGLALIAHDGVMVILAILLCLAVAAIFVYFLL